MYQQCILHNNGDSKTCKQTHSTFEHNEKLICILKELYKPEIQLPVGLEFGSKGRASRTWAMEWLLRGRDEMEKRSIILHSGTDKFPFTYAFFSSMVGRWISLYTSYRICFKIPRCQKEMDTCKANTIWWWIWNQNMKHKFQSSNILNMISYPLQDYSSNGKGLVVQRFNSPNDCKLNAEIGGSTCNCRPC
jgi:hypothetical protein